MTSKREQIQQLLKGIETEELIGRATFLASRASDLVTGTAVRVDGGYAIR